MNIPAEKLSPEALSGLVEEFVTRDGTDYGEREPTLEEKKAAVLGQLARGEVVISYDPLSQSCTLLSREDASRLGEAETA